MNQEKKEMDMCEGPLAGKILRYTLPLALSGILQLCFNAADMIVVGRYASGEALAAVGSTGALINLIINVFMGLAVGVSVCVAHAWGAKNKESVRQIVHTAMLTSVIAGMIVLLIGFFGCRTFLSWMGTPDNVIALSTTYMKIYFLGMPACMVYNFGASVLRSIGDTKRPLIFLVIAGIVNVLLNLLTVIGLRLGVAGVAIATAASQVVSAALVVRSLMKRQDACRLVLRDLRIYPDKLMTIVRVGLPAGLQGAVFSISNVLIQSSINSFGSVAMEGNTAAGNLEGFIYNVMNAFYHTSLTFTGQNVGARKPERIPRIALTCIALSMAISLTLSGLMYLFREPLLAIYRPDAPEAVAYGSLRMSIIVLTYFLCGIMEVFTGSLRGMGASLTPMLISLAGACVTRVIWIYTVFAAVPTLQVLYSCYPVSWLFTILMQIVAFFVIRHNLQKRLSTPLAYS
ncbi:MAG: MATE family efflux transporter [Clostridia bacterium]|nr:MATE family efflux transporter [Clostridia bacterium]